jgi:hypothetical protein
MSQRERQRRRQERPRQQHPLDGLANEVITVVSPEGCFPLLEPLPDCAKDLQAFDRAVCGRGVKQYVRPVMPNDLPAGLLELVEFIYVQELQPGIRRRRSFQLAAKETP